MLLVNSIAIYHNITLYRPTMRLATTTTRRLERLPSAKRDLSTASSKYLQKLFSLEGRSCIITGGGTGIGAALAMGLARAGAHVVLTGRRELKLQETCDKIQLELANLDNVTEQRAHYYACDITQYNQTAELLKAAEYASDGIPPTILVNNAGVNVRQPAENLTSEHWQTSLNLMLVAPFMLTRAMAVNMKEQKYGRVISLASLQSFMAFPDSIPYAASKSGTLGLTRALSEAYSIRYENVTCNAIAPGYVKTELTASVFADQERAAKLANSTLLGRNSVPQDLVGAAVFLASPASSYITGQTITVDGGFTSLGLR